MIICIALPQTRHSLGLKFPPHSDTWSPSGNRLSSASYSEMHYKLLAKQVPPAREDRARAYCSCLFVICQIQAQAPLALEISRMDFVVMVNPPIFGCPVVSVCMPWVLLSNSACSLYSTVYVFSFWSRVVFLLYFSITLETLLYVICVSAGACEPQHR